MARKGSNASARQQLRDKVEEYIWKQGNNTFNYKQVSAAVGAKTPVTQRSVAMLLAEMAFDGEILEVEKGKYKGSREVERGHRAPSSAAQTARTL